MLLAEANFLLITNLDNVMRKTNVSQESGEREGQHYLTYKAWNLHDEKHK